MLKLSAMGAALVLSTFWGGWVRNYPTSAPQLPPMYEYVGKVICGPQPDSSSMAIARGFYATTVNVRNQGPGTAHIRKQALWTLGPGNEQAVDPLPAVVRDSLRPGQGLAAECKEFIANTKTPTGLNLLHEGLIIIVSDAPLDVIGVYTAGPPLPVGRQWTSRQIATMEIDRFPLRRVPAT